MGLSRIFGLRGIHFSVLWSVPMFLNAIAEKLKCQLTGLLISTEN